MRVLHLIITCYAWCACVAFDTHMLCLVAFFAVSDMHMFRNIYLWDLAWVKEWSAYRLIIGDENSVVWDIMMYSWRWRYHSSSKCWEQFTQHCSKHPRQLNLQQLCHKNLKSYICKGCSKHVCLLKTYAYHDLWISKEIGTQINCCFPTGQHVFCEYSGCHILVTLRAVVEWSTTPYAPYKGLFWHFAATYCLCLWGDRIWFSLMLK